MDGGEVGGNGPLSTPANITLFTGDHKAHVKPFYFLIMQLQTNLYNEYKRFSFTVLTILTRVYSDNYINWDDDNCGGKKKIAHEHQCPQSP